MLALVAPSLACQLGGAPRAGPTPTMPPQCLVGAASSADLTLSFEEENPDGAIATVEAAIASDPGDSHAYMRRGLAHATMGDLDQAIADMTRAIKRAPWNAQAYANRGSAYGMRGEHRRA